MRADTYTNMILTVIAVALTFLCWERYEEKTVVHAQNPAPVIIVGATIDMPVSTKTPLAVFLSGIRPDPDRTGTFAPLSMPVMLVAVGKNQSQPWDTINVHPK
jgi:hypothetical protein